MEEGNRPPARPPERRLDPAEVALRAKALALAEGFDLAGIAPSTGHPRLEAFSTWIRAGRAGEMGYLASQAEKRSDLTVAFPWARSVLCVGLQYDTPHHYSTEVNEDRGWIARYAWGDDYHEVMKSRLDATVSALSREFGPFKAKTYVDTGPLVERVYAAGAGLGAWGKNTCLLHPEHGSWFFLGEAVTDLEMAEDGPREDMCGSCTACLDACPTQAFKEPYVLDATLCISYLTIEIKEGIPEEKREGIGRHVFGCDICQDVCPWNRRRRRFGIRAFEPRPGLVGPDLEELSMLDQPAFSSRFRRSPVKRAKRRGLLRNVAVALGNSRDPKRKPILERLAGDADPVVRDHALWALRRLSETEEPL